MRCLTGGVSRAASPHGAVRFPSSQARCFAIARASRRTRASRCSAPPASPVVALADARSDGAERLQRDDCGRVPRARLRHRARASAALLAGRGAAATSASPALRAARADSPCPASPESPVAMLADARVGRARRFPAKLEGSAGTGNRPTIRKPCSTFASAMPGSAMLRLRRSPRPLSPAPTVTSASTEMNVWRSRARLRRRAGARPLSSGRTPCCGNVRIAGVARRACGLAVSGLSGVSGRHAR